MKKWLKMIALFAGLIVLAGIAAIVCVLTFVSPNRLKPYVTEQVKKYTGREIVIDGDLSWTFFPSLGIKTGHLELTNPAGFKQKTFAEIQSATVSVKALPLLRGRIESTGIMLDGLKLYLIKNANGAVSWGIKMLPAEKKITDKKENGKEEKEASGPLRLSVRSLDVTNALIVYQDEVTKQQAEVNHLNLHAKNITLTKPFPFNADFAFKSLQPAVTGKASLTSVVSLNAETQYYVLNDLDLTAAVQKGAQKYEMKLLGDVVADLQHQKVQIDNLRASMANLMLQGKATVSNLSTAPRTVGHLQIKPFDVKKWLQAVGCDVASVETLKNLSGELDFTAGKTAESLAVNGNIAIEHAVANKVQLQNIRVAVNLQNNRLSLPSFSAALYQGSLQGQAMVNMGSAVPQITLQTKLANIQAEPLFKDIAGDQKLTLSGAGNVDLQLTMSGKSSDALMKSLNGNAQVRFNDGVLHGIDVGYLLDSAYALASKKSMPATNEEKTRFGVLTASAVIQNGILSNQDLYVDSPRFDTKGNGSIDLPNQQINYRLQTQSKQKEAQKNDVMNLYNLPVPIIITGNLKNPSIRLDVDTLMKAIAAQQLQKAKIEVQAKVHEKIQEQLKGKVPEQATQLLNNLLGQ